MRTAGSETRAERGTGANGKERSEGSVVWRACGDLSSAIEGQFFDFLLGMQAVTFDSTIGDRLNSTAGPAQLLSGGLFYIWIASFLEGRSGTEPVG